MSTIQLDFQLPQRFGLEYVGADNARHRPVMIHRALFGSVERFFAILLEHYAGALPTWLAPEQVRVLPVRDDHERLRRAAVADRLRGRGTAGRRWTTPTSRSGAGSGGPSSQKVPYVLVVGDDDVARGHRRGERRGRRRARARGAGRRGLSCARDVVEPRCSRPRRAVGRRAGSSRRGPRAAVGRLAPASTWPRPPRPSGTASDDGCVFCRIAASGPPSADNGVVWRGELTLAVLNAYPYASGHLLVLPVRHLADLDELTAEESADLWAATRRRGGRHHGRLRPRRHQHRRQPGPGGRGGIPAHLHLHVLPRWSGDTNFMTVGGRGAGHARVPGRGLASGWPTACPAEPGPGPLSQAWALRRARTTQVLGAPAS